MRREHDWGILLLFDTRVHDNREFANIDRCFGAEASVWSLGTPNGGGTSILFFKSVLILAKYVDPEGHFCRADFLWEGEEFSVFNIYAPADSAKRRKFCSEVLKDHLQKHKPNEKCFFAGDFNFVENLFFDRTSSAQGGTVGSDQWNEATEFLQLTDLFRNFHSSKEIVYF
jgi:exonuclease III